MREEVDGETLDVRLRGGGAVAVAVVLALLVQVHLLRSSLARRAEKLRKARRGRHLVGVSRQVATVAPPSRDTDACSATRTRHEWTRARRGNSAARGREGEPIMWTV